VVKPIGWKKARDLLGAAPTARFCLASPVIASDSEVMSSPVRAPTKWRNLIITFVIWTLVMFGVGMILNRTTRTGLNRSQPAGFGLGMVHGALMPLALPRLAVGGDVAIYAVNNTGRSYHLGYTLGVNLCGAAFFGFSFWWYSRAWRRVGGSIRRSSA
jgi:hypothetical protein